VLQQLQSSELRPCWLAQTETKALFLLPCECTASCCVSNGSVYAYHLSNTHLFLLVTVTCFGPSEPPSRNVHTILRKLLYSKGSAVVRWSVTVSIMRYRFNAIVIWIPCVVKLWNGVWDVGWCVN
jgi:hypothetical protein